LGRQCRLLSISRSLFYYAPKGESTENLALTRRIDELFLKYPFYDSRQMAREGISVGRQRDAPDGAAGHLSGAENQRPPSGESDLPLSSQGARDRPAQSGLVR
jgi:putative transposase